MTPALNGGMLVMFRVKPSHLRGGRFQAFSVFLVGAVWAEAGVGPVFSPEPWSDPVTWHGFPPMEGEVVTIPAEHHVVLDTNPPDLGGLIVRGRLTFAEKDLTLSSRWILIDGGTLSIGAPDALHVSEAVITLTGTDEEESIVGEGRRRMGTKCIGVMHDGRLELHGARAGARHWTSLAGHAPAGARQLRVTDEVDWRVADELVLAPSGFDPTEAEKVTVRSVENGVIHFEPPLRHDHWGELQSIGGHTIDERAEVACLTRNIVIQGDEASEASAFGGHLMFGPGTAVQIEGVEFYRMGQKGHAGRYPVHWHLTGDRQGDYVRGSSVHHSYHRAIVVHGSSNVLVDHNVSYDVWSHAFVPAEDGSESGNRFVNNLAILTRALALADFAFPVSAGDGSTQSEGRPSAFWLRSPDQILVGNHAAGVLNGMGFFFDGPGSGDHWSGEFSRNTAHSCSNAATAHYRYPALNSGYGLFVENHHPRQMDFEVFTAYKNSLAGVWLEVPGHRLEAASLADNGAGAILFQSALEDSVIVGQTSNINGKPPTIGRSLSGGVHLVPGDDLRAPSLRNVDFIDQRDAGIVMLGTRLHPRSHVENLTFRNTKPCRITEPLQLLGGFTDAGGTLRGDGVPVLIHGNDPLVMTPETEFDSEINGWVTPLEHLQYLSFTGAPGAEEGLGFTVLLGEDRIDLLQETGLRGQAPSLSGYVPNEQPFIVSRFDPLPDGVRIAVEGVAPGFVELELPFTGNPYLYGATTAGRGQPAPDFERAVLAGEESWYVDAELGVLVLRLHSDGPVYLFDRPFGGIAHDHPEMMWKTQAFGYEILQDAGAEDRWGSFADPDRDGFNNRLEYFLATDPLRSENPLLFDSAKRRLSFLRNPLASGLKWSVSYSSDLSTWYENAVIAESPGSDGRIHVSATAPALPTERKLFMVLRVEPIKP